MKRQVLVTVEYNGKRYTRMFTGHVLGRETKIDQIQFHRWLKEIGIKDGETYSIV